MNQICWPVLASRTCLSLAASASILLGLPAAAQFVPNETLTSLQPDLLDFEFSQSRGQFTWVDSTGSLWVASVDRNTGQFKPLNGKGVLIDAAAMTSANLQITYNGPEWISMAKIDQIVYTKFLPNQPRSAATARLALAAQDNTGAWSITNLSPLQARMGPYASLDAGDTSARISYIGQNLVHYWRNVGSASSEAIIPGLLPSEKSVRFVSGARALIYSNPAAGGIQQVFQFGLDTQALEQLTFDGAPKDLQTVPWMWQAPEFGNDFVFQTVANYNELRVYRKVPDASGGPPQWQTIYTATLPTGAKFASQEPFTYNGRSYIFAAVTTSPYTYPTAIWISNIDATNPRFYKVSDDSLLRARIDPEVFITANGPLIYYNRFNPSKSTDPKNPFCSACSEGVFRANPGLPAPR
jgi:hypothetical protein